MRTMYAPIECLLICHRPLLGPNATRMSDPLPLYSSCPSRMGPTCGHPPSLIHLLFLLLLLLLLLLTQHPPPPHPGTTQYPHHAQAHRQKVRPGDRPVIRVQHLPPLTRIELPRVPRRAGVDDGRDVHGGRVQGQRVALKGRERRLG